MTKNNQIQTDMKYDESYLSNKDWNLNTFATLYHSEKRYFDAEIKRTKQEFSNGANVLEIGFGNGKFLQYAKQSGWNVEGTELNPGLIELAKSKGFKVHAVADLSQFASDHYDLIVAFDLLEHLSHEQIENLFLDVKRILKKGGVFLARYPNGDSPFGLMNQHGDVTHITTIGYQKALYFVQKTGVELVFYGGEKHMILKKNIFLIFRNSVAKLLKLVINRFAKLVYEYPYDFSASNAILIFKKK